MSTERFLQVGHSAGDLCKGDEEGWRSWKLCFLCKPQNQQ